MTGLELLQAIAAGNAPGAPIAELMGFEPVEAEEGRVLFAAVPASALQPDRNGPRRARGDAARFGVGCAVHTRAAGGHGYTTLELKVNFTRPITSDTGRVLCEGPSVHRGGRARPPRAV